MLDTQSTYLITFVLESGDLLVSREKNRDFYLNACMYLWTLKAYRVKLQISFFNLDFFISCLKKILEYNPEIQGYWLYLFKAHVVIYS